MTLGLYIAKRFLWMLARVTALFFALMMLVDAVEKIRSFADARISAATALHLAALATPEAVYNILPLILILSSIALFFGMARSSELVIVRASGRSGLRFLLAPVTAAFVTGALVVAVVNPLVAATSKQYDALSAKVTENGRRSVLSVGREGFWLRQGDAEGQAVIRAARTNLDGTELFDTTFLIYDKTGEPVRRVDAVHAKLVPGGWALEGAKDWTLTDPNPELSARRQETGVILPTDLTSDAIRDSFDTPAAIPIWALPAYIRGLDEAGFSARRHRVWLQMELSQPLMWAAMVLVAAGFTMRHTRSGRTERYVLAGVMCGFVIFFLRNFAQVLGESGQIPIALAAWAPPVIAMLLALGLLLQLEDG
jgi:lipopolysaccharide export system permease protein